MKEKEKARCYLRDTKNTKKKVHQKKNIYFLLKATAQDKRETKRERKGRKGDYDKDDHERRR